MAEQRTRLRINLAQREFEVEGSEAFVNRYVERLDELLEQLNDDPKSDPVRPSAKPLVGATAPQTFGELLEQMPRSATDVDRILVAGYFAQSRATDQSFSTGEANALLTEQGIKVGNPSQCVRQNLVAKRVFKHQRRYRVSQTGMDHLRQLIGLALGS